MLVHGADEMYRSKLRCRAEWGSYKEVSFVSGYRYLYRDTVRLNRRQCRSMLGSFFVFPLCCKSFALFRVNKKISHTIMHGTNAINENAPVVLYNAFYFNRLSPLIVCFESNFIIYPFHRIATFRKKLYRRNYRGFRRAGCFSDNADILIV